MYEQLYFLSNIYLSNNSFLSIHSQPFLTPPLPLPKPTPNTSPPLQYKATDFVVPGPGTLTMSFKPADGGEPVEMVVKEFAGGEGGRGGCGMGMFNTTEVGNGP